ncbi:unnamed protein product, partial [Effrenium voratum]
MTDAEWPEKAELERWLMNTVKDPDPGALFLRQVLQMNPAYGSYLQTDKDLVSIVQLFAKRLRARMMAAKDEAMTPGSFYEPLCEMTWRITGHVLHAVLNLESMEEENGLPVPKEPLGQVRMLVQTNMELSRQLNMLRRDYLRELTQHRDKQRIINHKTQGVLQDLQENPVMFFEPLKFVLDDVTKEFIKLVVEERVKLDQKGAPLRRKEKKSTREIELKERASEKEKQMHAELSKVREELRKVRTQIQDTEVENKRLVAAEKSVREQLEPPEDPRNLLWMAASQFGYLFERLRRRRRNVKEDLDEEDLAILREVASKGYYHNRPKSGSGGSFCPQKLETAAAAAEVVAEGVVAGGRKAFDAFQAKWDRFDDDAFVEAVAEAAPPAPSERLASAPRPAAPPRPAAEFK